jgi:penicillin-binding protein 1A
MAGDHISENLHAARDWIVRHRIGLTRFASVLIAVIVIPITLLYLTPAILVWSAPRLDLSQDLYAANRPIAFTFLDADGQEIGHRGALVGDRLTLGDMPPYLPAAFIAMEDRRFYDHYGIDIRGLVRAAITNFHAGHVVAGGSTITQQTAKIVFLTPTRTFGRKFTEMFDAAKLEKSLSKKQILELYLNRIYLGSGAYGVDGAAHVYFGKSARNVTVAEAAMLATLTRAPTAFSPRRDLDAAQTRTGLVLRAMVETGAITQAQADDARANPAQMSDHSITDARNYFLDTAADEATRLVAGSGLTHASDLIVHTTLEPRLQEAARHAVAKTLNTRGGKMHASEAAVVLMKPDGAVSALIGGRDYDESVFNRATQARRQPGSAFKPFVYLAAIENGISPWDVRDDGPVDIDGWTPTNFGGRSYGTVTLADALAHSINTITAGLAQEVGIDHRGRCRASLRHRLPARSQCIAGARNFGSHAHRTDDGLCDVCVRRRARLALLRDRSRRSVEECSLQAHTPAGRARDRIACRSRSDDDAGGSHYGRHRQRCCAQRPPGGREDGYDTGLPRRLVRRLHNRLRRGRVGGQ